MSSKLWDMKNNAYVAQLQIPLVVTGSTTGALTADMITGDGLVTAEISVGAVGASTPTAQSMASKIQESTDGTTWTDCTDGAFTAMTAVGVQLNTFQRTARYMRAVNVLTGTTPSFAFAINIFEQKKQL